MPTNSQLKNELLRVINKQIDSKIRLMTAKVIEVDEDNYNVTVENNLFKKSKIPLRSLNVTNKKGIIIVPKLNSTVILYVQEHESKDNVRILNYLEIDKILITINNTEILIDEDNVSIKSDKIYINTENEDEPVTLGNSTKTHIEDLYDYIIDLYNKLLTHLHGSPVGTTTPLLPPELTQIPVKISEVNVDKGNSNNILSLKNFTE